MSKTKMYLSARISTDAHKWNNEVCDYLAEHIEVFKPQDHNPYNLDHRKFQRQPRSAYPFFIGPKGVRAEAVLAETGCLGMMVGGVRLSERTPNRVNTTRVVRGSDVLELARTVREKVMQRSGVELAPGVFFVDEDGREIEL